MAEIDKNEVSRIVGHDDIKEYLRKKVAIIKDKRQHSIRIPSKFAELSGINTTKDYFEFTLIPEEAGDGKFMFTLKAELKKG